MAGCRLILADADCGNRLCRTGNSRGDRRADRPRQCGQDDLSRRYAMVGRRHRIVLHAAPIAHAPNPISLTLRPVRPNSFVRISHSLICGDRRAGTVWLDLLDILRQPNYQKTGLYDNPVSTQNLHREDETVRSLVLGGISLALSLGASLQMASAEDTIKIGVVAAESGAFVSALFENWESEFLQMGVYVTLTAILFQRGSAESRDPDEPERDGDELPKSWRSRHDAASET